MNIPRSMYCLPGKMLHILFIPMALPSVTLCIALRALFAACPHRTSCPPSPIADWFPFLHLPTGRGNSIPTPLQKEVQLSIQALLHLLHRGEGWSKGANKVFSPCCIFASHNRKRKEIKKAGTCDSGPVVHFKQLSDFKISQCSIGLRFHQIYVE